MFRNLKLSTKLVLTFVPLFVFLILESYYLTDQSQEKAMLEQAKNAAIQRAQIVRETLVSQMVEKYKIEDSYLERLQRVGGLKDLYVRIRPENLHLTEDLVDSARTERLNRRMQFAMAKGEAGNEVFQTGSALFINRGEALEAVVPFKAEKKCQACHEVPINHVLGVAHIQIPLTEINKAIAENSRRTGFISLGFAGVFLLIGMLLYRTLIQKPVRDLLAATEAMGQGNLAYAMNVSPSNDELGLLSQSFDRMRKALKQSQEALRTSMVGQIATSLTRDFRAPMRQILGAVEQIEKGTVNDQTRIRLCTTARTSVVDMNKMAQDLLDFTTGDLKVNMRACNVPSVLSYVADAVKQDLERDMVRLELEQGYQGSAPLDYERIGRAMINIVSYAVNYIPPGGVIRISTAVQGAMVVFKIADNGNGIPPQFRDKIFEPFTKLVQEKGLGLALSLAKRIVDVQGGRIELQSEEGKGTTFTITMPLA
ncbi:MAG: HAMP domain-containing sensor histidine kinase [Bacteroidota bacterium]